MAGFFILFFLYNAFESLEAVGGGRGNIKTTAWNLLLISIAGFHGIYFVTFGIVGRVNSFLTGLGTGLSALWLLFGACSSLAFVFGIAKFGLSPKVLYLLPNLIFASIGLSVGFFWMRFSVRTLRKIKAEGEIVEA